MNVWALTITILGFVAAAEGKNSIASSPPVALQVCRQFVEHNEASHAAKDIRPSDVQRACPHTFVQWLIARDPSIAERILSSASHRSCVLHGRGCSATAIKKLFEAFADILPQSTPLPVAAVGPPELKSPRRTTTADCSVLRSRIAQKRKQLRQAERYVSQLSTWSHRATLAFYDAILQYVRWTSSVARSHLVALLCAGLLPVLALWLITWVVLAPGSVEGALQRKIEVELARYPHVAEVVMLLIRETRGAIVVERMNLRLRAVAVTFGLVAVLVAIYSLISTLLGGVIGGAAGLVIKAATGLDDFTLRLVIVPCTISLLWPLGLGYVGPRCLSAWRQLWRLTPTEVKLENIVADVVRMVSINDT